MMVEADRRKKLTSPPVAIRTLPYGTGQAERVCKGQVRRPAIL